MVVGRNLVFNAGEHAEFAFYGYVKLMCVVHYLLGEGNVLLIRQVRAVDHHRREAVVDAAFAKLEAVAMVEMENDLGMLPAEFLGIGHCALSHVAEQGAVGIVARTLGNLKDNGRFFLGSSLDDGLELLHVVEVKSRD